MENPTTTDPTFNFDIKHHIFQLMTDGSYVLITKVPFPSLDICAPLAGFKNALADGHAIFVCLSQAI